MTGKRDIQNDFLHKLCFQDKNRNILSLAAKSNHPQKIDLPPVISKATENDNTIHLKKKNVSVNINSVHEKENNAISSKIKNISKNTAESDEEWLKHQKQLSLPMNGLIHDQVNHKIFLVPIFMMH